MTKIVTILIIFFSLNVFSQSKGTVLETRTFDTTNDYRKLSFRRTMDIRHSEWGKYYNTLYLIYEKGNKKVAEIAVANYKKKGVIEVYVMPCRNGKIVEDMITGYQIKSSDFKGLVYTQNFKKPNGNKKELVISYVSNKKEHLKIKEVNYELFALHYKIIN